MQPFDNVTAITPSDSTVYSPPLDGFIPGSTGNIVIRTPGGSAVTITGVVAGFVYPIRVDQIRAATTATGIIGLRLGAMG